MISNRGVQKVINNVRDNTPYTPNKRVNQMSNSGINGVAENFLNTTVMNEDYVSTNTESTNRDKSNRANNNSDTYNKNILNVDNAIENCTITRYEDNKVINTFINSEDRIVGVVEEKLQAARVQGLQINAIHLLQMMRIYI